MIGGYTGDGFKTVIPSRASAKVSFRLVGDQDPARIRESFRAFVRERVPADCRVEFIAHGGSPGLRLPYDGAYLARARTALRDEWGVEPALVGSGGSIPVVGDAQAGARHGFADDRLRARRRSHPFAQREVRCRELSRRHPLMGARSSRRSPNEEGAAMRPRLLRRICDGLSSACDRSGGRRRRPGRPRRKPDRRPRGPGRRRSLRLRRPSSSAAAFASKSAKFAQIAGSALPPSLPAGKSDGISAALAASFCIAALAAAASKGVAALDHLAGDRRLRPVVLHQRLALRDHVVLCERVAGNRGSRCKRHDAKGNHSPHSDSSPVFRDYDTPEPSSQADPCRDKRWTPRSRKYYRMIPDCNTHARRACPDCQFPRSR